MELNDFSNKTLYGIKSDTVRHCWVGYFIFILVSSFVGDTTILIASIRYKAFNLHKLIVVIIQHIAVCDLFVSSLQGIPRLVTLIVDEWILGTFLCHTFSTFAYYFVPVGVFLICSMTTCKLLILKSPFRVQPITVKHAHVGCTTIWVSVLILPAIILLIDYSDVAFNYKTYDCDHHLYFCT